MKNLIIILFISTILASNLHGQERQTSLKVYGICSYENEKIGQKITCKIKVDNNKCDPEVGFISIEEKIYHFEEALKAKDINFKQFTRSIDSKVKGSKEIEIFKYRGSDNEIAAIIDICKNQGIEISGFGNIYEKNKLSDQDNRAICALQDAMAKAEIIANELGYEHVELVGVDDDSSSVKAGSIFLTTGISISSMLGGAGAYSIIGHFKAY